MSARLRNRQGAALDLEPFFFFDQVGSGSGPLPPSYGHAQAMAVAAGGNCPPAPSPRLTSDCRRLVLSRSRSVVPGIASRDKDPSEGGLQPWASSLTGMHWWSGSQNITFDRAWFGAADVVPQSCLDLDGA